MLHVTANGKSCRKTRIETNPCSGASGRDLSAHTKPAKYGHRRITFARKATCDLPPRDSRQPMGLVRFPLGGNWLPGHLPLRPVGNDAAPLEMQPVLIFMTLPSDKACAYHPSRHVEVCAADNFPPGNRWIFPYTYIRDHGHVERLPHDTRIHANIHAYTDWWCS